MPSRVLYPSRAKTLVLLLGSSAFTIVGVLMIREGEGANAWLVALFFGLCTLVALVTLMPGASYLRLTPEGFEVRSMFRPPRMTRWVDTGEFGAVRIGWGTHQVVYNESNSMSPRLAAANRKIFGYSSALPDTYGLRAGDLAATMNEWRARYSGR